MTGDNQLSGKYAETAKKMLWDVTSILEKENIPYILDYGTLLGIVREKRLLPWDTDLDISIDYDFVKAFKKIRWKIWLKGYRTRIRYYEKDVFGFKKGSVRIIKVQTRKFLFFRGYRLMDIFTKRKIDNQHFYTVYRTPYVLKSVPAKYYDNRTKIEFDSREYSVPEDYRGYLSYVYGDWKTPVKEWDAATSDNCVREFSD